MSVSVLAANIIVRRCVAGCVCGPSVRRGEHNYLELVLLSLSSWVAVSPGHAMASGDLLTSYHLRDVPWALLDLMHHQTAVCTFNVTITLVWTGVLPWCSIY
jgi:hypothetical protein